VDRRDREAREARLLETLNRAWGEYANAPPEEKAKAKERFKSLLEDFSTAIRRHGDTGPATRIL